MYFISEVPVIRSMFSEEIKHHMTAGFVRVMENLESHGILLISFSKPRKSWNFINIIFQA